MDKAKLKRLSDAEKIEYLVGRVQSLEQTVEWFQQQLFGRKSEKREIDMSSQQLALHGWDHRQDTPTDKAPKETVTYQRRKQRNKDCVSDSGLRFGEHVPKKTITLKPDELTGPDADQYEVLREEITYRLAQKPASYVVLEYKRPVIKRKGSSKLIEAPAADNIFAGSIADVSFLAGMLVEKFVYHIPLYRQHQRLTREQIILARSTLTQLNHRAITELVPIYDAQFANVLTSKHLAIDETPIKAGRSKPKKMRSCWYWPIYGDDDEVIFTFSRTRGHQHLNEVLKDYQGTILTDGHGAYSAWVKAKAKQNEHVVHAQCWVHSRREFIKAEKHEPEAVEQALSFIGSLYHQEKQMREQQLDDAAIQKWRAEHAKPIVDEFFVWCDKQCQRLDLVPSNPLSKALKYVRQREQSLRVFLSDPQLPMDTNHLERTLRVVPMGRKNWLFNWTEVGAELVGVIQSLLTTCQLHGVHPYTYLVDVLQRISTHPANRVDELTPRRWKTLFADNPMTSDLMIDDDFLNGAV